MLILMMQIQMAVNPRNLWVHADSSLASLAALAVKFRSYFHSLSKEMKTVVLPFTAG